MQSNNGGPEEWVSGSDGIQAAMMNSVWHAGADREFEGASDLRCKIQLAGRSQYIFDGQLEDSPAGPRMMFVYKPIGLSKREHVDPGVYERSITLVFPVLTNSLAGCGREDAAVDRAIRLMDNDMMARQGMLPAALGRIAASILDADRSARYFEKLRRAKIDELACSALDVFLESFADRSAYRVTARERRQILEARELLLADLAAAPALNELAAAVGSNRTKLNRGFQALFGASPYQILQQERMVTARKLLELGEHTVTEIAEKCGYEHISNFSLAFKAFYGIAPSTLRRSSAVVDFGGLRRFPSIRPELGRRD